ncbi:MAG TPA: S53 family peptidase [Xanthomonadaceae bacterium]
MKSSKHHLHTLLAALAALPVVVQAHPAIADLRTAEAPRVTRRVDDGVLTPVRHSHLALLDLQAPIGSVPDATPMQHVQLVLRRSALRQSVLDGLIAAQHDPHSPKFHQWVTPEEFGNTFGVADADIAAASAWLTAHGLTVNAVYPNRMQIDFSGTAGSIGQAFHVQERRYAIGNESHIANDRDISLPSALKDVVVGVAGLNDLHPRPLHVTEKMGQFDPATGRFNIADPDTKAGSGAKPMAIYHPDGSRVLVPYDLAKMYAADQLYAGGVTGKGMTIAVVEDAAMQAKDWYDFVDRFKLVHFGGTFKQIQPLPVGNFNRTYCVNPDAAGLEDDVETLLDAEWATALAPGANIEVASCAGIYSHNFFGGVFTAANNLINGKTRPDIISASYGIGEHSIDLASKTAVDAMWEQADAEGISVFVASGDSGSNPNFNDRVIQGQGIDANALATSPHVTAVGGTDVADLYDHTTAQYFGNTFIPGYGNVLSYIPEIPWNMSCGNDVAARFFGVSALALCKKQLIGGVKTRDVLSEASSGGSSSMEGKPAWQAQVHGAAGDGWRDLPDVSLFAGSFEGKTLAIICDATDRCVPGFPGGIDAVGGTSLSAPMFAGIQALIDQGMQLQGGAKDQGNAAPTLYALAEKEYGTAGHPPPPSLATCNADNGVNGTSACVFHNVTRGNISSQCVQHLPDVVTPDCYFYGTVVANDQGLAGWQVGLTSTDPIHYNKKTLLYPAQPGWSFAAGLGSVNAANLLSAWETYDNIP